MKGKDNRAFMKKVGERAYSPENYDAYMDLNVSTLISNNFLAPQTKWDRYSNKQKRQALSGFNDKYIKTNDLNVYSPTVDSINDALKPDSNKKTLNKAFGKVHQEVNQNLENMHFSYQSGLKNGNEPIPRPKTRRW
jgi:hypothetical protein